MVGHCLEVGQFDLLLLKMTLELVYLLTEQFILGRNVFVNLQLASVGRAFFLQLVDATSQLRRFISRRTTQLLDLRFQTAGSSYFGSHDLHFIQSLLQFGRLRFEFI